MALEPTYNRIQLAKHLILFLLRQVSGLFIDGFNNEFRDNVGICFRVFKNEVKCHCGSPKSLVNIVQELRESYRDGQS